MKKVAKYSVISMAVVAVVLFLGLKKNINLDKMNIYETEHFTIYYESLTPQTLADIESKLEINVGDLYTFFAFDTPQKGKIVVYKDVDSFQRAYLGFLLRLVYGDWASGGAYKEMVLLTSPENPGSAHTYNDTLDIIVHEYVHTLVYHLNNQPRIWLDEGLATYLAGQEVKNLPSVIPSYETTLSQSLNDFVNAEGYAFAYTYIDYLVETYGREKVVALVKSNDFQTSFSKSEHEIYEEWIAYLSLR